MDSLYARNRLAVLAGNVEELNLDLEALRAERDALWKENLRLRGQIAGMRGDAEIEEGRAVGEAWRRGRAPEYVPGLDSFTVDGDDRGLCGPVVIDVAEGAHLMVYWKVTAYAGTTVSITVNSTTDKRTARHATIDGACLDGQYLTNPMPAGRHTVAIEAIGRVMMSRLRVEVVR